MKMFFLLLISGLSIGEKTSASEVKPVFDDASFRIGLTIPFTVPSVRATTGASIREVSALESNGGKSCVTAKDPLVPENFLLKCKEAGEVRLRVVIVINQQLRQISYGPLRIEELKAGYKEPEPEPPTPVDPEIQAGRDLLFTRTQTGGGFTCVGCHLHPSMGGIMFATEAQLRQISLKTGAMPRVRDLTADEARMVVKYLQTIADPGAWP